MKNTRKCKPTIDTVKDENGKIFCESVEGKEK